MSDTLQEMQKHVWFILRGAWRLAPSVLAFLALSVAALFWPLLTGVSIGVALVCIGFWVVGRRP